jgi:hypothetical protein
MNKIIVSVVLIFGILSQPALASTSGSKHPLAAPAQKVKAADKTATAMHSSPSQCKKYFALIGALVAVPC